MIETEGSICCALDARLRFVDSQADSRLKPAQFLGTLIRVGRMATERAMKVCNSLKTAKLREKGCKVVRRRGRVYVINKRNPRFKARQG